MVNNVEADSEDAQMETNDFWLATVTNEKNSIVTAKMNINNQDVHFQLDSGAEVNTICQKYVKKHQVKPSKKNLLMWNG
jgi:hypothetical protein